MSYTNASKSGDKNRKEVTGTAKTEGSTFTYISTMYSSLDLDDKCGTPSFLRFEN